MEINNEIEMGAGKDLNAMRIAALKDFIEQAQEEGSTTTAEEFEKAKTELEQIEGGADVDVLTHKEAA